MSWTSTSRIASSSCWCSIRSPAYVANEEYRKLIFGDAPYAHIGPTAEAIDKLDRMALEDFRDSLLVPNNAHLILVGKLPARADLLKAITTSSVPGSRRAVPPYTAPKAPESKRQLVAGGPARIGSGGHAPRQDRGD